jgi:hypothetical protein
MNFQQMLIGFIKSLLPLSIRIFIRKIQNFFFELYFKFFQKQLKDSCKLIDSKNYLLETIKLEQYEAVFCGYYDISPFNPNNDDLIVLHGAKFHPETVPRRGLYIDVLIYQRSKKKYLVVGSTDCWNWQQGARAHWLDAKSVCFNVRTDNRVTMAIYDLSSSKTSFNDISMNISAHGKYVFDIDYSRLHKFSEYGYHSLDSNLDKVSLFNLESCTNHSLFSYTEILDLLDYKIDSFHINHLLPSPDLHYLIGIIRGYSGVKRIDSLFLVDIHTGELRLLIKNSIVSHYCWLSETSLLCWCEIKGVGSYYVLDEGNNFLPELVVSLNDGHPSRLSKSFFVSDIYEIDFKRRTKIKLFTYDIENKSVNYLFEYDHFFPFSFNNRCDMHPSVSPSGSVIQFDIWNITDGRSVHLLTKNK